MPRHIPVLTTAIVLLVLSLSCTDKVQALKPASSTVFFDDFDGTGLDRNKWNVEITHEVYNNEQQAYIDSSATLYIAHGAETAGAANGVLVIKPIFHAGYTGYNGLKADFLSARINTQTKVEFTYGSLSARMKLPSGAGFWPAFWALGNGNWPDCGEIDVMENVGGSDWVSSALHGPGYSGNTPLVKKSYFQPASGADSWHIYSVDWSSDSILFKIDGLLFYSVTRPMVEAYGRWAFDNPKFLIVNFALGGAYPGAVNGVKTPYYGLPQSSVDAIKAGNVKVLVDWVKVSKLN